MGAVVTAHVTVLGGVFAILNDRIDRVESRIDVVDDRVDSINTDIRSILVGIEQVKARLGIIENETGTRFSQ